MPVVFDSLDACYGDQFSRGDCEEAKVRGAAGHTPSRRCPLPPDPAWQFPWLRLHLVMRDLAWGKDWPIAKREVLRCVELRCAKIRVGWFN
jgi:hypothetical protein